MERNVHMPSIFNKSLLRHFLIASGIFVFYMIVGRDAVLSTRIINGMFIGGFFPVAFGTLRLVSNGGTFDLFLYSHRKLWKYGKKQEQFEEENEEIAPGSTEKLGTYYEYLQNKKPGASCKEPLLAGGFYIVISLILVGVTM